MRQNITIAGLLALGAALMTTAAGLVYLDMRAIHVETTKLEHTDPTAAGSEAELAALDVVSSSGRVLPAFAAGVTGAACAGLGGTLLVLRLPPFQRR